MRCLVELARRLASGGDKSLTATFSAVAALAERCDHSTLAVLLSLVTAGCGTAGANQLPALAPSAAAAEALEASANCGSFEWAFEHYSQLPSGVGDSTDSPYFQAAGFDWRFRIFPGGDTEESATYISGGHCAYTEPCCVATAQALLQSVCFAACVAGQTLLGAAVPPQCMLSPSKAALMPSGRSQF